MENHTHLIRNSDAKSGRLSRVCDLHDLQPLIYFAINSQMSAFTSWKCFFSISRDGKKDNKNVALMTSAVSLRCF